MSDLALTARGLTKRYRLYDSSWDRLREALTRRSRHREMTALDNVGFDVARGESIGIIGENGAGKSTLLKILAGVVAPTSGTLQVNGTVAAILELAAGFHPDFTGRQNIALNAALLGLSEREVRARTPGIIAWSELGDFIEQPVKTYSTGMTMRLAFSIATQVEPDVLIVDEALSVGDGYFQKKCMDRLQELTSRGLTLLFCSHALYYISSFCHRALWLRSGRVEDLGPVSGVVARYEDFLVRKSAALPAVDGPVAVEIGETPRRPARLDDIVVHGGDGGDPPSFRSGERLEVEVAWQSDDPDLRFHVGVGVNRADGVEVLSFSSHFDGRPALHGERRVRLALPSQPLRKGNFTLYVFLLDEAGLHVHDQRIVPDAFRADSPGYVFGLVDTPHSWEAVTPALAAVGAARA